MATGFVYADLIVNKNPGGVKMVCSSVVLGLMLWTLIQCGSQSVMMAAIEVSAAVKVPVMTIQSYINSYSEWPIESERLKRAIKKIPPLDNKEIENTVSFAQGLVNKMARHELNIIGSNINVKTGTAGHAQFLESLPTSNAYQHHQNAIVALKASQQLGGKYCYRLGIDDKTCAKQIASLPLLPSTLGTKCAIDYGMNIRCPEMPDFRSYDGACNHRKQSTWGRSLSPYTRILSAAYEDGFQKPRGSYWGIEIISARKISSTITKNLDSPDSSKTLAVMQWGQFIYHDMSHTVVQKMLNIGSPIFCCATNGRHLSPRHIHPACAPIDIPEDDPFYLQHQQTCMSYVRSMAAINHDCKFGPLEQMNQATHYLDGSVIYGTTPEKAQSLRSYWQGRLRTERYEDKEYLPKSKNSNSVCIENGTCYDSGDVRVNMLPGLAAMHTIWVREHNRIADRLYIMNPHWNDERLYQEARKIVIAEIQHITYNEWLPVVLGLKYVKSNTALAPQLNGYSDKYNEKVDPSVSNSFASAAMSFISSMVEGRINLYEEDRNPQSTIQLKDSFNKPNVSANNRFDSLIRGIATQSAQKSDLSYSDVMTNYFYKNDKMQYGMDKLSLDIQRGRDHGLPGYNKYRKFCGLREAKTFEDFADTISKETIGKLKELYRNVDEVDLLVGGMAENHKESLVGPTFQCIIAEQFIRTRSGDKFFYDNGGFPYSFTADQLKEIKKTTLSRVFCDNTDILNLQPYLLYKPMSPNNDLVPCGERKLIASMNLEAWKEKMSNKSY